jgi:uncharacterized repeat protein (TIGR02543 family)
VWEGYVFPGWNTEKDGNGDEFTGATAVSGNITVYAQWSQLPGEFTVTVKNSYASDTGEGTYTEGTPVIIRAGSRADYVFNGWKTDKNEVFADEKSGTFTFTMPASNVIVSADWKYNGGGRGGGGTTTTPEEPGKPEDSGGPEDPAEPEEPEEESGEPEEPGLPEEPEEPGGLGGPDEPEKSGDPVFPNMLQPNNPGSTLILREEDGGYYELSDDGTPLGEWRWDEEAEEWIFIPYPPLSGMPNTSDNGFPYYLLYLLGASIIGMGATLVQGRRKNEN